MYPYSLLEKHLDIFPLFGPLENETPCIIDYSLPDFLSVNPRNMNNMIAYNKHILSNASASWGIGGYLEDRSHILTGTHIRAEWRIYHLGIDILFPADTKLYNPLDGEVYEKWYEPGDGNYWGYIIIKYSLLSGFFYALYWHLSEPSITSKTHIRKWETFAQLWKPHENGNWFPHLHLQAFTGKDIEVWKDKWYCKLEDIGKIRYYCPDPSFLLRY